MSCELFAAHRPGIVPRMIYIKRTYIYVSAPTVHGVFCGMFWMETGSPSRTSPEGPLHIEVFFSLLSEGGATWKHPNSAGPVTCTAPTDSFLSTCILLLF